MEEPEMECKDKTNKTKRRSGSAWKRTRLLLTCSSCHGNDSDSEPYGASDLHVLDVPLCSGDKMVDLSMVGAGNIGYQEDGVNFFDSEENLGQNVLGQLNSPAQNVNSVNKRLGNSAGNLHDLIRISVAERKEADEEFEAKFDAAMKRAKISLEDPCDEAVVEELTQANRRNNIDTEDDVSVSLQKDINESEGVDYAVLKIAMEEACDLCKAEKLKSILLEAEIEYSKKTGNEEISGEVNEPKADSADGSKKEQACESTADSSVNPDCASSSTETEMPVKQLAVPRRYVLGTGEAHVLPDVEDTDVAAGGVLESGEGLVQEFLEEVISERELIAMRVEVINDLLARECHSQEVVDTSLLPSQVDEMDIDGSKVFDSSLEAEDGSYLGDEELVGSLASDLASRDELLQSQSVEDAAVEAVTDPDCKTASYTYAEVTKLSLEGNALLTLEDCVPDSSESASSGATGEAGKLAKEMSDASLAIAMESTYGLSTAAEEVPMMNVFYEELVQEPADISSSSTSDVYKEAEEKADILDSANTEAPSPFERGSPIKIVTECEEAATPTPFVADFHAADPALTSRWRGVNPRASQEVIQIAQEIVDPMLAKVARVFRSDLPSASTPSLSCLTDAVVGVAQMPSELLSSDHNVDTLLAATKITESALADLGEASLGCLQPTSSVTDLDALLDALETTESTLANLEEASSGFLLSTSNESYCDKKESEHETSQAETELTYSREEERLRYLESLSLDEDSAVSQQETATMQTSLDLPTLRFPGSMPTEKDSNTSLMGERLSIWDLNTTSSRFLRRLRYTDKYLSVPQTEEKLALACSDPLSVDYHSPTSSDEDENESTQALLEEVAPKYPESKPTDKDLATSQVETESTTLPEEVLEYLESAPTDKDHSTSLEQTESTIVEETTLEYPKATSMDKALETSPVDSEPTILAEAALDYPEPTTNGEDLITPLEETESTILAETPLEYLESTPTDKDLTTSLEQSKSMISVETALECPESNSTEEDTTTSLGKTESSILAETTPENLEPTSTDKDLAASMDKTESTILAETALSYAEVLSSDKDPTTSLKEIESTILAERAPEYPEPTSTDADFTASSDESDSTILAEASPECPESIPSDEDLTASLSSATSPREAQATDRCLSNECVFLEDCDGEMKQPTSLENATGSLVDLSGDRETSVIELANQPSMMNLMPSPSLMGLATPSDDSIPEVLASASSEEAGIASMAAASTSAEFPDQGKEQHRAARNNKKRNKKRNRRNKK